MLAKCRVWMGCGNGSEREDRPRTEAARGRFCAVFGAALPPGTLDVDFENRIPYKATASSVRLSLCLPDAALLWYK